MITKRSLARQTHPTHDAALTPALNDHSGVHQLTQRPLLCAAALATREEFAWTGDAAEEMSIMRQQPCTALTVPPAVIDGKSILTIGGEQHSDSVIQ